MGACRGVSAWDSAARSTMGWLLVRLVFRLMAVVPRDGVFLFFSVLFLCLVLSCLALCFSALVFNAL